MILQNENKFLVECHFPLHFTGHSNIQWNNAFKKWKSEINRSSLSSDDIRYGGINKERWSFWIQEIGDAIHYTSFQLGEWERPAFFEMYIRTLEDSLDVVDVINGKHGENFFVVNIDYRETSNSLIIEKILNPILLVKGYKKYEESMDDIFAEYKPYHPFSFRLPKKCIR